MADKRISQLIERTDIANNDVLPIVASGATTTNKVTISTIQDWMQDNLDVGVTSVGITLGTSGTDVNVTGSPITTSGNITINIPTASATNRGLLSSADWSTFNGKQNSITLTTSGTSGAATLVGSTLNIPNYSTGVANAYVPYVGAIGSVTLGYNSLSASQINIDGASPTGGSYLGFKHSTSVNTGTDGYTSMYTFGTNTIAFKSVSGGNSKDFSFSMVGITPNVAGGRQYTLPDASGTLALTSDLDGYVTIGTTQTITGSKTFNSKIIGQDATLTSSGSTNTLEVFHTSGSGHAVEIQKAGNGEGLRVIKTSGSGNAVTITGGLLSAEAATLTGALNGTTASFSGNVTSTGGNFRLFNGYYITAKRADGVDINVLGFPAGSNNLTSVTPNDYNLQNTGGQNLFSVSSTGAGTFGGAINLESNESYVNLFSTSTVGMNARARFRAVGAGGGSGFGGDFRLDTRAQNNVWNQNAFVVDSGGAVGIGIATPSRNLDINGNLRVQGGAIDLSNDFNNQVYSLSNAMYLKVNGTERLTISSTGAATFSSSVTAASLSGAFATLSNYGSATSTALQLGDANNGLFRPALNSVAIATNGAAALTIASTGAATFSSSVTAGGSGNTLNAFSGQNNSTAQATIYSFNHNAAGWSIYSAQGVNYFAGNTGIGTASPSDRLNVEVPLDGGILIKGTSANHVPALKVENNSGTRTEIGTWGSTRSGFGTIQPGNGYVYGGSELAIGSASVIKFGTGASNSERLRVTDNGLTFNGDTAAANALDDYEEGTWTPVVRIGATTNTASVTRGRYTKIGNVVYIQATITGITKSGTGNLTISGLPFTVGPTTTFGDIQGTLRWDDITSSGVIYPYFNETNTIITMQDFSTTGFVGIINDTQISSSYQLYGISGFYMV